MWTCHWFFCRFLNEENQRAYKDVHAKFTLLRRVQTENLRIFPEQLASWSFFYLIVFLTSHDIVSWIKDSHLMLNRTGHGIVFLSWVLLSFPSSRVLWSPKCTCKNSRQEQIFNPKILVQFNTQKKNIGMYLQTHKSLESFSFLQKRKSSQNTTRELENAMSKHQC